METFVSLMTAAMNESTTGPLTALTTTRSASSRSQQRQSKPSYGPGSTRAEATQVKEMSEKQREQRWQYLSNERAMWGQRREALERKKEAEEMAQCTFTPKINKAKTADGGTRKFNKYHFMSPIRVTNNVLSSE